MTKYRSFIGGGHRDPVTGDLHNAWTGGVVR